MIEVDAISLLVTADTDLVVAELEERLRRQGYTLNYFAPPHNLCRLVDAMTQRIPNLYGAAFGGMEDLCLKAKWSQASGEIFTNVAAPRSATGPGLKKLAIGAGPWLGLPIQATLRIFQNPLSREVRALAFAGEAERELFLRSLSRLRLNLPLVARLDMAAARELLIEWNPAETALGVAWWGEPAVAEGIEGCLEALLEKKKARLLEVKPGSGEDELLDLVQLAAAVELDREVMAAEARIPRAHLELTEFLQGNP